MPQRIVIVGGGIIGVSTAHYLAEHHAFDPGKYEITLIEACSPACGASGKAGGLLSRTAFPKQIAPLSFRLHEDLANRFGGEEKWGYRKVMTLSVEGTAVMEDEEELAEDEVDDDDVANVSVLPKDLDWLRPNVVEYCELLGGKDKFAQIHPYYFTNTHLENLQERGLVNFVKGRVNQVHGKEEGKATGVSYVGPDGSNHRIDADIVVITAGPWTSKLVETCPVVGMKVPSITVTPTRDVSPFCLFTEIGLRHGKRVSPEVYPRQNEVYICGESVNDPLPVTADLINANEDICQDLFRYGAALSKEIAEGHIKQKQACYLPVVDSPRCSGPFIGKTNVPNLLLSAGHTCWGINNGPVTGLLLSELILEGSVKSANIRSLEPRLFFDASVVLS